MSERSDQPPHRMRVLVLVTIFGAALVWQIRVGGFEPSLWLDTIYDSQSVTVCLEQNHCFLRGVATSVPGVRHGTTWLHMRTFWAWLGLSLESFHVLLHIAGAVAMVLTALIAQAAIGPWAGVFSVVFFALILQVHDIQPTVVYNNRLLLFLGTLSLALCIAAAHKKRLHLLILAAAVGALTTEVHAVFVFFLPCLVVTGLLMPRRFLSIGVALAVFICVLFAISPEAWVGNIQRILVGHVHKPPLLSTLETWNPSALEKIAFFGCLVLLIAAVAQRPKRRMLLVLLAFVAPILVVFEVMVFLGAVWPTDKYFSPWVGGIAAALGVALFALGAKVVGKLPRVISPQQTWSRSLAGYMQGLTALALFFVSARERPFVAPGGVLSLKMADAPRIIEVAKSRGWTVEDLVARVRSVQSESLIGLIGLEWLHEPWAVPIRPKESLLVLRVPSSRLPKSMPEDWQILHKDSRSALVAIFAESWIDWDTFQACVVTSGHDDCRTCEYKVSERVNVEENQVVISGWPWPFEGEVLLKFKINFPEAGGIMTIHMPELTEGCTGRVVSVSGRDSWVASDGRFAMIKPGPGEKEGLLVLRYAVGTKECPAHLWQYAVPFFVEITPEKAGPVLALLRHE